MLTIPYHAMTGCAGFFTASNGSSGMRRSGQLGPS